MKRFLSLLLVVASTFILALGEVHASGDPGFTVYAYTSTDTTHDLPSELVLSELTIFVDGILIYSDSAVQEANWMVDLGEIFLLTIYDPDIDDSLLFELDNSIENYIGKSVVIIIGDSNSFDAYGFTASDTTHDFDHYLDDSKTSVVFKDSHYIHGVMNYPYLLTINPEEDNITGGILTFDDLEDGNGFEMYIDGTIINNSGLPFVLIIESASETVDPGIIGGTIPEGIIIHENGGSGNPLFELVVDGNRTYIATEDFVFQKEISHQTMFYADMQRVSLTSTRHEKVVFKIGSTVIFESTPATFAIEYDSVNMIVKLWGGLNGESHEDYYEWSYSVEIPNAQLYFENVIIPDTVEPVLDGQTFYATNYYTPITEAAIRSQLTAFDDVDGDITDDIVLVTDDYTPNWNDVGQWDIVYSITDSSDNESILTVTVVVLDDKAPVFSGGNSVFYVGYSTTLNLANIYNTITATDEYDGIITFVEASNEYTGNEAVIGTYEIVLEAEDASGNVATRTLTIHVVDNLPPVISGPNQFTRNYNQPLSLATIKAQLTATDDVDGDISDDITVISSTYRSNLTQVGSYTVLFGVTDSNGNNTTYQVTVVIQDLNEPIWFVTNGFLITIDEAVTLSTNQILSVMLAANLYPSDVISQMYVIEDNYEQNQTLGSYNMLLGYTVGGEEQTQQVFINVVTLSGATNYTIMFDSNGGSYVPSISVPADSIATQPTAPVKTGYVFSGWFIDEALTQSFNFATTPISEDITLYAKWTVASGGGSITPPPAEGLSQNEIILIAIAGVIVLFGALAYFNKKKG